MSGQSFENRAKTPRRSAVATRRRLSIIQGLRARRVAVRLSSANLLYAIHDAYRAPLDAPNRTLLVKPLRPVAKACLRDPDDPSERFDARGVCGNASRETVAPSVADYHSNPR